MPLMPITGLYGTGKTNFIGALTKETAAPVKGRCDGRIVISA